MQTNAPPPPPPGRWIRASEGSARVGLPTGVFKRCLESGSTGIRTMAVGKRGLVYIAENDLGQFADRLQRVGATR